MLVKLDWLSGTISNRVREHNINPYGEKTEITVVESLICGEEVARNTIDKLAKITDWFAPDRWTLKGTGLNYYSSILCWGGETNCHIAWNDARPEMKVFLQFSGRILDQLGPEQVDDLISMLQEEDFTCSRLDICLDVFDKTNVPIDQILESLENYSHYDKKVIVSRVRRENCKVAGAGWFDGRSYKNWYFGSRRGGTFLRFYDKKVEQKLRDDVIEKLIDNGSIQGADIEIMRMKTKYWYRIEAELKRDNADYYFKMLSGHVHYAKLLGQILNNTMRIIEEASDPHNANLKSSVNWWENFINMLGSFYFDQLKPKIIKTVSTVQMFNWQRLCSKRLACLEIIRSRDINSMREDEITSLYCAWKIAKYRIFLMTHGIYLNEISDADGVLTYRLTDTTKSVSHYYNVGANEFTSCYAVG